MKTEYEVCEKCFLIECCCEADRLQVIADDCEADRLQVIADDKRRADGYVEFGIKNNGDIRWIKKKKVVKKL